MNFQPSELAKISLLMAFALWGERHVVRMREFKYGLVIPGVAIAVTLGLIFVAGLWHNHVIGGGVLHPSVCGGSELEIYRAANARRSGGHCGGDYERSRAQ